MPPSTQRTLFFLIPKHSLCNYDQITPSVSSVFSVAETNRTGTKRV